MKKLIYKVEGLNLFTIGNHSTILNSGREDIYAQFDFDKHWKGCIKVATFIINGKHYAKLLINDECEIPQEVLSDIKFEVFVEGRKKNGYSIKSHRVKEWRGV